MSTEALLKSPNGTKIWTKVLSNERGRLPQGNKYGTNATNNILFIAPLDVPTGCKVTNTSFVCDPQPLKTEPCQIILVVGGEKLTYSEDAEYPASNMIEFCVC